MAKLEFGLLKGASVVVPYDQMVNDQYRHYQIQRQRAIEQENKAKLFADDFDYNNAVNTFDNPLIKDYARKQISAIGTFVRDNPGWERDVSKRIQYKSMIRELKDNPDLNRGLQSDANYKQLQKDLAEKSKNPQLFDRDGYNDQLAQWQNYLKFGNQEGEEAALTQGKKPFVYTQPQDFVDLAASGLEKGNKFNQFTVKPLKGGGLGSYEEIPDEKALDALAIDEYSRNKKQYDREYIPKGFQSPFEYAKANIRAGVKTKKDYGDYGALAAFEKLKGEKQVETPSGVWKNDIVNTNAGTVNGALLRDAFGATPPLKIKNNDGTAFIDFTGSEVNYTGRHVYLGGSKQSGVKYFEVSTLVPLEQAIESKIYNDSWTNKGINPAWDKKAFVRNVTRQNPKTGEEETKTFIQMNDFVPFDINNSTYQGIYDQKATTTKFQQAPQEIYQDAERPLTVIQNGVTYNWNPSTKKYE